MLGIFFLVRRSLAQHALSTVVTIGAAALASGLVMAVFAISAQTRAAFVKDPGFDAIVGARGSQLQLVLNSVFHLETSPGNIPWAIYRELEQDPRVELAVPYAVGDNYLGFRIVGTTREMFEEFEYRAATRFAIEDGGRLFDEELREGVIGSHVAARTGLAVGSRFHSYHGVTFDPQEKHAGAYVVVGVLKPTNSPADRVIWIPIEGIFRMDRHVLRGTGESYAAQPGQAIPDEHKEVSAVMLKFRGEGTMTGFQLQNRINRQGKVATMAWPIAAVLKDLFEKLFWVTRILTLVAYLVVAVAVGAILASIYNTMNERRREFAILRALGARRATVFSAIVAEAATIATVGAALGYLVYGIILAAAAYVIRSRTGVALDVFDFHDVFWITPLAMIVLGALAGLLPALKAYRTPVAENLVPNT
ncbi:MAG: ABC transporter permease [Planctomycetota bacterium]|jgi:putative ABC transport system permease protein